MNQIILLLTLSLFLAACNPASEPTTQPAPLEPAIVEEESSSQTAETQEPEAQEATATPESTEDEAAIETVAPTKAADSSPAPADNDNETAATTLGDVETWSYLIDSVLTPQMVADIVAADDDLVVLDFVPSAAGQVDDPIAEVVDRLHTAEKPKLALAYLNIGQAEPSRAYWQADWKAGDPWQLIEADVETPNGNLPVAYWHDDYRDIWLAEDGYVRAVVAAGFDGLYLDGLEAYADPAVVAFAEVDESDPAQEMVWLVGDIAAAAREEQPDFIIVGQNAAGLVAWDEEGYLLGTLDGLAQERLWFDDLTDSDLSETQLPALKAAAAQGRTILTVDYPLAEEEAAWVEETARALGFIPVAGERLLGRYRTAEETLLVEMEETMAEPHPPAAAEAAPSGKPTPLPPALAAVESFLYQLQNIDLAAAGQTGYDLIVMDYAADGTDETAFSAAQVEALRNSAGGSKILLSYMSIGEAEDYRFYWRPAWDADQDGRPDDGAPAWLDGQNPNWAGNYKVRYWDPDWQKIIFAYTDKLIDAGFDGAYLDIIDAFSYYEDQGRETAAQEMADFVAAIAAHARRRDPDFYLFPQNGADLAAAVPDYLDSVSGVGQEDIYYGYEADDQATPPEVAAALEGYLDLFRNAGKLVLTVDYATTPAHIDDAYAKSRAKGYVPFVTVRGLDALTINPGYEPE